MRRICLCLALGMILVWSGDAAAGCPIPLAGSYAFTGESGLISAPDGFDTTKLTPLDDKVSYTSFSVQGIRIFNPDGTGSVQATEVETIVPAPNSPSPPSPRA